MHVITSINPILVHCYIEGKDYKSTHHCRSLVIEWKTNITYINTCTIHNCNFLLSNIPFPMPIEWFTTVTFSYQISRFQCQLNDWFNILLWRKGAKNNYGRKTEVRSKEIYALSLSTLLIISIKVQDTHGVLKDINRDHLNKQVNQFIFEVYFLIYVFLL